MANLRVLDINAADIRTIKVRFSDLLSPYLTTSNVLVRSKQTGNPDALVTDVYVSDDILVISTLPMTPYGRYEIVFQSYSGNKFTNLTADAFLIEDGRNNVKQVIAAEDPTNKVRDALALNIGGIDGVYDLSRETVVRTVINHLATFIAKSRNDARQTKSDNYLRLQIKDELKTRGFGPWDRLGIEGAYEITRVGLNATNASLNGVISFNSFPSSPVTLQATAAKDTLTAGSGLSTFDAITLTVSTSLPVTKLISVQIQYQNGNVYNYNIQSLGYRIQDATYDKDFARRFITLDQNQFMLSDSLLDDPTFVIPGGLDKIIVSYEYKHLGKIIDETSVTVTQISTAVRETAPPISTLFSTQHAPILLSGDVVATSGGIQFLDPYSATPFRTIHPAFLTELPYRQSGLPKNPGEYSVDYETGRIFVYGAVTNDGTGDFPPVMTYNYRGSFQANLDYTYVPDTFDLVASPLRFLTGQNANINFKFEQTLVPGIDYVANVHKESVSERIENRLASLNSLNSLNSPVTNVFRIYNETTGEIYKLSRFNENKIYFSYVNPPTILDSTRERSSFTTVLNEQLILDSQFTNTLGTIIFKFLLSNKNVVSATEDCIGSSFNSSISFSRPDIFSSELFYDGQELSASTNYNRIFPTQYQIDYRNGIVYVGVTSSTVANVGSVSYKKPVILPNHTHTISVSNIYYSLSQTSGNQKTFDYSSFGEASITPIGLDFSDERFLNNDITNPYYINSGTITVTYDIKALRGLYDAYDLNNHIAPINFASSATFEANVITVDSAGVSNTIRTIVLPGKQVIIPVISAGISISSIDEVIRADGYRLLDGNQIISNNIIYLSNSSGAHVGDIVDVVYHAALNASCTPIVDYNKGDFFADYSYLADEILVSYEWGDNVIDFRTSTTIPENKNYYVSYIVGALRDSLLNNFGSLVNIPELQAFDEDIDREVYRDAVSGALQTFTKGPTVEALTQLVASITKINPKIIEALFNEWALDSSYLGKIAPQILGTPLFTKSKFDQGVNAFKNGDAVTLPISNNLRIEEGTLEMFVQPDWDGLDNDATLTFSFIKDGYSLDGTNIYIGSKSYNPTVVNGKFSVNRTDVQSPIGLPSAVFTQAGMFIYYDINEKSWKILAKDIPANNSSHKYSGTITSSGNFYDVQFIQNLGELSDVLRSDDKLIEFEFNLDGYDVSTPDGYDGYHLVIPGYSFDGIKFMSDDNHYLFDFGKDENRDRFSLYKDGKGYLVFEVWDQGFKDLRNVYQVSADIRNWNSGDQHHVAVSWALNSSNRRDEMHLFIDGLEVPNIAKYGNIPEVASTNRFRTVVPEQVVGSVTKNSVTYNDLHTTQGSNVVNSPFVDFSSYGITIGDSFEVLEQGFTPYTITNVSGHTLTLNNPMPATLSNARFSANPVSFIVGTEIDTYTNIGVFVSSGGVETEIPGTRAKIPSYSIQRNAFNQRVLKVLGNLAIGDLILIKTFGLNHRRCRNRVYVWSDGYEATIKTSLAAPVNLDDVNIKAIPLSLTSIGLLNSVYSGGLYTSTLSTTKVTNVIEGRTLEVRISSDNTNFSTPVTVTIHGTSTGPTSEVLSFSSGTKKNTVNKWKTITSVVIVAKPIDNTIDACAIEIKEAYSITNPNGNNTYPVIRFAYQTQSGISLQGTGNNIVFDTNGLFLDSNVGSLLSITAPLSVAGIYTITQKIDNNTVMLNIPTGTAFTNGSYKILNISIGRSGFQNGFFFLEYAGSNTTPYPLPAGWFDVDYAAYLSVSMSPVDQIGYIGNSITLDEPAKAVIDELRVLNYQLTDVRVGEVANGDSITLNANSFAPFTKNIDTLSLLHFDESPIVNDSDFYIFANKNYIQSGQSINDNFGHCVVLKDQGIIFDNDGKLSTVSEGMIEFWVSPRFDTYNDPNVHVYFDAAANVVENVTSLTKGIVKIEGNVKKVLYVRLANDKTLSGTDYFNGGKIDSDGKTLILNSPLPYSQTPVQVAYIPSGVVGNRITIATDGQGNISFTVNTGGKEYQTKQPIFWPRDTWHRIRASYKFNRADNKDELRLFIDGEEKGIILFGQNLVFGAGLVFGQASVGVNGQTLITDINFVDTISQFSLGQDFAGNFGAQARFDNLKISDRSINPLLVGGQVKDVYYNSNVNFIYPSVEDSFTTFLFDFDQLVQITDDFAILRDPIFGLFNFDIDVIDSFGIVTEDDKVKKILVAMINALKPATSKVNIKYFK